MPLCPPLAVPSGFSYCGVESQISFFKLKWASNGKLRAASMIRKQPLGVISRFVCMYYVLDSLNRKVTILMPFSSKMLGLSTAWALSYYSVRAKLFLKFSVSFWQKVSLWLAFN